MNERVYLLTSIWLDAMKAKKLSDKCILVSLHMKMVCCEHTQKYLKNQSYKSFCGLELDINGLKDTDRDKPRGIVVIHLAPAINASPTKTLEQSKNLAKKNRTNGRSPSLLLSSLF